MAMSMCQLMFNKSASAGNIRKERVDKTVNEVVHHILNTINEHSCSTSTPMFVKFKFSDDVEYRYNLHSCCWKLVTAVTAGEKQIIMQAVKKILEAPENGFIVIVSDDADEIIVDWSHPADS
jgi:hypothetical protein